MTILPNRDDMAGWRRLFAILTALGLLVYLYLAFLVPGTLQYAPYTIQDDARLFLAWMARLQDHRLLEGDLIADYWQSVSPPLFNALYGAAASIGLQPLTFSRILPVIFLAVSAVMAWRVAWKLTGRPLAAFLAAAMVMGFLLHEDSVFSATPRAFSPPLLLLFLDGLLRNRARIIIPALLLLAALYPPTALVGLGMVFLSFLRWRPRPGVDFSRRSVLLAITAMIVVFTPILLFQERTDRWHPILTLDEAQSMPNLRTAEGRSSIVDESGTIGWICSGRMGFFPNVVGCGRGIAGAGLLNVLLLLPLAALGFQALRRPLPPDQTAGNRIYAWALISAAVCYTVAAIFVFQLHLPSRYSQRLLGLMEWLAIGQILGAWLDTRLRRHGPSLVTRGASAALILLIFASFVTPDPRLVRPRDPEALAHIAALPPETRIAGLSEDLDAVMALTGHSVLATTQHAVPYHMSYFHPLRERLRDTLTAATTTDRATLAAFFQNYDIDVFAVERSFLDQGRIPDVYQTVTPLAATLGDRDQPSVVQVNAGRCTIFGGEVLVLLSARCLSGESGPEEKTPNQTTGL